MAGSLLVAIIVAAAEAEVAGVMEVETAAEPGEEIVVTATRTERALGDAPGAVTVIDREEIEETGGADIGDVVDEVEGVDVLRYGGPGSSSGAHLRGTYGVHTLVLVDGRTQNSPSLGGADLSALSPAFVERIEIVRGPASTLYGTGAVGGVIQVFTRKIPDERSGEARLDLGSFNTASGSASYGIPFASGGALVGVHGLHTDGHRDNSECDLAEFFCKVGLEAGDEGEVLMTAGYKGSRAGWPGPKPAGGGEVSSLDDFGESARGYFQTEYRRENFRARASVTHWFDKAHESGALATRETTTPSFDANSSWQLTPGLRALAGAGASYDLFDVDSSTSYECERTTGAAWGQLELGDGAWQGVAGLRWDEPSDYEGKASARLLGSWNGGSGLRLEAGVGTAFRAPTLDDLYYPPVGWAEGNPDLEPETSAEAELGVKFTPAGRKDTRLTAAIFSKAVTNLIAWAPDAGGVWRPQNLNEVEILGLELAAKAVLGGGLEGKLAYTYLDAWDKSPSLAEPRKLAYVPDHKLALGLDWSAKTALGKMKAGLSVGWASEVRNYYWNGVKKLPPYWLVGLRLSWSWEKGEIFLRWENLLDEEYSTQFGYSLDDGDYPMPGRSIFLGTKLTF